jgi:hypothetical protein
MLQGFPVGQQADNPAVMYGQRMVCQGDVRRFDRDDPFRMDQKVDDWGGVGWIHVRIQSDLAAADNRQAGLRMLKSTAFIAITNALLHLAGQGVPL